MSVIDNMLVRRNENVDQVIERTPKSKIVLRKEQIERLQKRRETYFSSIHSPASEEALQIIRHYLESIRIEVNHAYLPYLRDAYAPIDDSTPFEAVNRIRCFDITRWITDAEENTIDKLVNVYHAMSNDTCNIALIYQRTCKGCKVSFAVVNTGENDPALTDKYQDRLRSALMGNFPGIHLDQVKAGIPDALTDWYGKSVAAVSNLSGEKSEKFISQSMEKLLDGFVPEKPEEEYTLVLLASPIRNQLLAKQRLADLHTQLSPFASWQTNQTYTESLSEGMMKISGFNIFLGLGIPFGNIGGGLFSSKGYNTAQSVGKTDGLTLNFSNYSVSYQMEQLEAQMKRMEQCSALGMWNFAAYVISGSANMANNTAHSYLALTQGENSYLAQSAVNVWHGTQEKSACACILQSLSRLRHPQFGLREELPDACLVFPVSVDATTVISGRELAYSLNMPRKAVSGLPVVETVSFGRDIQKLSPLQETKTDQIKLGEIYHMKQPEKTPVMLDVDSLCSHTFISGSTGAGKSNLIYQLLLALFIKKKRFLVIEPAKGEYKNVFGGYENFVTVFGTNPLQSKLLELNPFSFHSSIHVLEHIDRLVEIFNACWPMYAAMPAVLKDAMEQCYRDKGWDLFSSVSITGEFPTFRDLLEALPKVIASSAYSVDTKSDYSGALITRVRSLTNGINGQVLCSRIGPAKESEQLFERNVIADLSRVGSSETKSLIMGILVMKLQEYRMHEDKMNAALNHVTVLEEAHHLLRRTSAVQTQESSNLQGKSVEMIANAIAEMRTYGEGFIIADQAPGLLDESIIRNTNTKIILRLPDEADRVLVGKAMAMTDRQITELTRLPVGVAAVFQNDWIEPVLCKIKKFST